MTDLRKLDAAATQGVWPHVKTIFDDRGPNLDLARFTALLNAMEGYGWWTVDTQLKYMNLHIDTRENRWTLTGRDGNKIEPERAVAAMLKFADRCGGDGLRAKLAELVEAQKESE